MDARQPTQEELDLAETIHYDRAFSITSWPTAGQVEVHLSPELKLLVVCGLDQPCDLPHLKVGIAEIEYADGARAQVVVHRRLAQVMSDLGDQSRGYRFMKVAAAGGDIYYKRVS